MLNNLRTGLIYRNQKPHVKSIHAYFPSVAVLPDGDLVATFVLGEAFEAVNLRTFCARSSDGGVTWSDAEPLHRFRDGRLTSDFSRISVMPDGELIVLMARVDRSDHPDEGLANPQTLGFAPTEFLLFRSLDSGCTWSEPSPVNSPLGDVPLELCAPVTLIGGKCFIPTSPWKKWDGGGVPAHGIARMIALISHDGGKSWPEHVTVMDDPGKTRRFWESKIVELRDGRLCAVAWVHDESAGMDLPNHFALSENGGSGWSPPASTGLMGQTLTPFVLDDGRILCIYRRTDRPGLWAALSRLDSSGWMNEDSEPLWGHESGITGSGSDMAAVFRSLKFGAPCIARMNDGAIFAAFWAYEDGVSNIRWFSFTID